MKHRIRIISILGLFFFAILACGIDNVEISTGPDLAATITAQAAVLGAPATATGSSGAADSQAPADANPAVQASSNSAPSAIPAPTNQSGSGTTNAIASGPVTVTVSVETNCRTGPGKIYNSVYSMSVSDVAEVIGKNTLTNYWIIKIPNGGGTCWLWGQYATVSGDTSTLAEFATPTPAAVTPTKAPTSTATPSPTKANSAPNPPTITNTSVGCKDLHNGSFEYTVNVTWADNSNDEHGFTFDTRDEIPNSAPIVEFLPANSTNHVVSLDRPAGTILTITIYAVSDQGYQWGFAKTTAVCP